MKNTPQVLPVNMTTITSSRIEKYTAVNPVTFGFIYAET